MTQIGSDFRHFLTKIFAEKRAFLTRTVAGTEEDCFHGGFAALLTQIGTEKEAIMTHIGPDFNSNRVKKQNRYEEKQQVLLFK